MSGGASRRFDKGGEAFYDQISALHKSIRGSNPDAALYWFCRMLDGGCDPLYLARRLVRIASEDIGNANPNALVLANSTFQAVSTIGFPESRIILSQCATYLASSAKSNAAYQAIGKAQQLVKETGDLSVPLSIRNAPTKLMKELGYFFCQTPGRILFLEARKNIFALGCHEDHSIMVSAHDIA